MQTESVADSKRVIVELTMTVEEARKVIWQGRGPHEPMGNLLDNNQIDRRDLAWAVDKAYKPEVRAAARTLLANWIGQPATLEATRRYGPEVVAGSHYLEQQELEKLRVGSIIRGYAAGAVVALIFFSFWQFLQTLNVTTLVVGFVCAVVAGLWINRQARGDLVDHDNLRQGRTGERMVIELLRTTLDNQWTIFRNLQLPGRKDDSDIVLVGPGGVWVLEVKAFRETVRVANGTWERQTKRGWKRLDRNPSKQATDNAVRLNRFLQEQGINRWVEKAVILSEPQAISNFEHAEDVWILPQVESQAANLSTRTPPTEDEIKRIVELFRELATKQVAAEEAKYKK